MAHCLMATAGCMQTDLLITRQMSCFGAPSQGDLNLNIAEAHAFNTTDKFSLDVFVVNGWTGQVWRLANQDVHSFCLPAASSRPGHVRGAVVTA